MTCQCDNVIKIFRGDDTNWNGENLLNFVVTSASPEIDLSTMTAKFIVGSIVFDNISLETGKFTINFTHQQTSTMPWGLNKGVLQILDADKRIKTVTNSINLFVTSEPFEEQSQTIDVTVPEGSPVTIELTVGSGGQGGGGSWGSITGDIQNQTDLQDEFATKLDVTTAAETYATKTELATKQNALNAAQIEAVNSGANSANIAQISTNTNSITGIEAKIPTQASSENQLADKDFVNSSVATNTANFIGTFNSVADLEAYSGTLTNNDYAFVISTDSEGNTVYNRYKYTTATDPASWQFEYALNNSSFTANQWAAINSGATSTNIAQIATNTTAIAGKQDTISDLETIRSGAALGATAVQPATLANYATTTDLAAKQDKTLTTPITVDGTQETTVEGALGAINTLAGKGLKNTATGANSLTVLGNVATGNNAINIGVSNTTSWSSQIVSIGNSSTTYGNNAVVIGNSTRGNAAAVVIGQEAQANQSYTTVVGYNANSGGGSSIQTAIGSYAYANGSKALAIGAGNSSASAAQAIGAETIQLGSGLNNTAKTLQVYSFQLLDGNTGKIPVDRLPDGIGVSADEETIVSNQNDTISTVAVREQNADVAVKQWVGTKAQYDAIVTKDPDTIYVVTDDNEGGITQIAGFNANVPVQRLSNLYGVMKWQTKEVWYYNFNANNSLLANVTLPNSITSIDLIFEINTKIETHAQNLFVFYRPDISSGLFFAPSSGSYYQGHFGELGYYNSLTDTMNWLGDTIPNVNTKKWIRIKGTDSNQNIYTLDDDNYTIETLPALDSWTLRGTMAEQFSTYQVGFSSASQNYASGTLLNYYLKANEQVVFDLRQGDNVTLTNNTDYLYNDIQEKEHWN